MERISTFNLKATRQSLRAAVDKGHLAPELRDPMQVIVSGVVQQAVKKPMSMYVFSDDDSAELRDMFSYCLVWALSRQIPSTLLVDCDFLRVGMSGIVPERDALGFLDLLLYGSSLGVITQERPDGVKVVGAGSFPVTKRMPFVMDAFNDASRRLVTHSRCVVYTGPMRGDEDELHVLIGAVDKPIFVRDSENVGAGMVDPIEEEIVSRFKTELASVRVADVVPEKPAAARVVSAPPREVVIESPVTSIEPTEPKVDLESTIVDESRPVPERTRTVPRESGGSSMAPRILTGVIGVLLVLLVAWWIFENRMSGDNLESTPQVSQSERTSPSPSSSGQDDANELTGGSAADTLPVAIVDTSRTTAGAETGGPTATQSDQGGEIADIRDADRPVEPPVDPADTGGRSGGEVLIGSEDIIVMDDLERNWQGYYVIHISSFRESIKARDEVKFLLTHEFPAFIVFLDLGAKGKWYRVYVGPIRTREETRELKKSLDDLPRVRFTRITKVAG